MCEDEEWNASTPWEANTPAPQLLCRTPSGLGPYPVSQPLISSDQVLVNSVGAAEATFGGVSLDSVQLDAAGLNAVLQSAQVQGQVSRLTMTSAFQGFDLACEISETAVVPHHRIHESLGFNPPLPQEPGFSSPAYRSLEFSPDLSQVQDLPNGNATGDPSYRFPTCNPASPEGERFPINEVKSAPEQYEIDSDDDDASLEADSDPQSLWDQSWVNLTDLPPDPSWPQEQGSDGCNALSVSTHVPRAQGKSDTTTVTWHVPLENSSVWYSKCRSKKLDLYPGLFAFSRSIVSQVPQGGAAYLPNLACAFMSRLLTWRVSRTRAQGRQFTQPACELVGSEASCWSSALSAGVRSVSPAPSRHQSGVLFVANLPGYISVSGDTCDNVLALACVKSRWGETSSPETNFEVSLCVEPGQDLDLTPRPLRFSTLLSRALMTQGDGADQGKVPQVGPVQPGAQVVLMGGQAYKGPENEEVWVPGVGAVLLDDPNPEPLRVSPASPCVKMVSETAAGSGVQASGVTIGECAQEPEVQASEERLSPQVHSSQSKGQIGEVQLSQQVGRQPEVQASEARLSQQGHSSPKGQTGEVQLSQQVGRQPEVQASEVHLSQQVHSSQSKGQVSQVQLSPQACSHPQLPKVQAGKALSPDVVGDQVPGVGQPELLTPRPIRFSPQRDPCEVAPNPVECSSLSHRDEKGVAKAYKMHLSQAGKAHSGQPAGMHPEGQVNKVHSRQHQPEVQTAKVHSGQPRPEVKAGKEYSGRPAGMQPGAQAHKVHPSQTGKAQSGQPADMQPSAQACKVHPSKARQGRDKWPGAQGKGRVSMLTSTGRMPYIQRAVGLRRQVYPNLRRVKFSTRSSRVQSTSLGVAPAPGLPLRWGSLASSLGQKDPGRQGGNLNLLMGYDKICQRMGFFLGGEDLSLISLGTSSIATMYRVTGAIKEHASSWSNPQQDLPTKTSPEDMSPEIVQEMNLELCQQPESRQPASAWLGPNVTEDQISDVPGSIVPRDHPLWPAIANTAVCTLDTIGSVLPRLIEAGLATYIWNKFLEGNFRNQHTTFHEQAEVKVGNHVLSQAAVLLQPLLLSRYNDCDKLGAFMEAVLVDLREHGPVQIPGKEGIRRDLLNLLAQLHRMSTVACSVKALYNSLDWRLTTRSYMALLLSLVQPDNLSGSGRLLAQRSEGPTPGQVPSGSGLVSAQLAEGPTSAQMSSGSNPYADLQQPGALANQGMDSVPGNRAKPFNQYALSVWSCVIGNHVFAEAVVGSALPCCCTYFRPAVPSPNPLPLMSPDGYPAESQVELKPQIGRVPSDCRPGPSGAKRTAAAMVWGPCPHYQKGFCRYGDLCRYQHVVQFTPTQPTTTRDWSAALPFSGTQVCPHFQRGFCKRGQACNFAHLQPEHECSSHEAFNNGKTLPTAPPRIRRPPLCAEARQELQSWNLLRECFKFHMGHCSQNKCGFQHSDLVPERRAILMKWIAPHAGAVSKENKEQEVSRPEGASGSQGPHWQWDPREAISLQDHMARESQDVPAASRKFTAPRPERHFQKGVKVSKLGSTILKCVSGASQRIVERGSVDRPKSSQPCVFAPPDACKPVVPRVLVKQSRCNKAGTVLRHFAKPTGIKRRTQIPNAPGTRMRAVKPQCVSQLSPVAARVPWADLQDSDEEEPPDSNSSPEEDMSARFGTSFSVPLRNQRELGDPAPVDCPSAMFQRPDTQDVLTEANQAAHKGEHKPNKGRSSTLDKLPAEPGHGSPSAVPFGSSSEVRVSGSGELKLSSIPVHIQGDSDGPCPMWANPFEVKVRGRSPTLRLGFSPKPVQHHKVRSQCKSVSPESCRCSSQPGKISSLHLTRPPGSRASSLPPPGLLVHKGGSSLLEGFECPAEAGGGDSPGRKERGRKEKGNLSCKEAFPCKNLADEVSAEKQRPRVDDKRSKSVPEQVGGEPEGGSRSIHRRDLDHSGEPEGGSKSIHRRDLDHSVLNYDMTLGYPGEGPVPA